MHKELISRYHIVGFEAMASGLALGGMDASLESWAEVFAAIDRLPQ